MSIKTAAFITITYMLVLPAPALSESDYDDVLIELVQRHRNSAPDANHELELVSGLEKLAGANPDAWLPQFWASYLLTQVVMSHPEDRIPRLDRAQELLNGATARAESAGKFPKADFLALQSLIYNFRIGTVEIKKQADELTEKKTTVEQQAFGEDQSSPVAMVMAATIVISEGQKAHSWDQIMAGHALLLEAQRRFAADGRPKGLTTHFSSEWVTPWIKWVERMYAGGFDAD